MEAGGSGGDGATASADAGRQLSGEGFEPTPDFDITNPQRPVPPREQLVEAVATLNGTGGSAGAASANDAGANDAGSDAGAL